MNRSKIIRLSSKGGDSGNTLSPPLVYRFLELLLYFNLGEGLNDVALLHVVATV